ncbi:MAG TPA: hypothetical protein PLI19_03340 [Erysipelotrichaceae bacterium]|nr:hypothetical protein [Erysipelotrichaceae bacterium]HQB32347.1 hypothetical protein [Erysipelotrichaceae bacterium]
MNQTIRIAGIIFCILFALISAFLNNKFRRNLENSIQNEQPDIERQIKKYLLFLTFMVIIAALFTMIIILMKKET